MKKESLSGGGFIICAAIVLIGGFCGAAELNRNQRLIVACHRLDVDGVINALRNGANVNSRFGKGDAIAFEDSWTHGWPMAAEAWTPLIALASASEYPDPPRKIQNTSEDLQWAREQKTKIEPEQIEQRRQSTLTIARILMSHNANLDENDGHGATALYQAVYEEKLELAKLLLRFNAKVNTKTGLYIDGTYNGTPLHRAYWSAELTKLLLEKGADPKAKDSEGETPLEWARRYGSPEVNRLYKAP